MVGGAHAYIWSIHTYGQWVWDSKENEARFDLWFYATSSISPSVPYVMKYKWPDGKVYGYYYSYKWGFYPNQTYNDSTGKISLSINSDRSQATLIVSNLEMEMNLVPQDSYGTILSGITINLNRTFNIFGNNLGNAAFCGMIDSYVDPDYYGFKSVLDSGWGAGLPVDAINPRCNS